MQKISSLRQFVRDSITLALLTALVFMLGIVLKQDGKSLLEAKADAPAPPTPDPGPGGDIYIGVTSCASNSTDGGV